MTSFAQCIAWLPVGKNETVERRASMRKERFVGSALAAVVLLGSSGLVACDKEDRKDVEEITNDADKELDNLDSDGKDD